MRQNRWLRLRAATAGTFIGLALFLFCLKAVSAAATTGPAARANGAAAGPAWHVDHTPGEGLVGYWKFDELSGTRTLNSALLANQTTLTNGAGITAVVPATVTVPDFDSLVLDGVNDAAQVNDAPALDVAPNSFSVAAWARRASVNTYDAIYDSGTEANKWWVFIADNGGSKANRFGFGVRGLQEVYSTRSITDTNWHHLAVVKSGAGAGNLAFYVDGALSGVVTVTNVLTPTGTKRIGALLDVSLSSFFGGDLDEVRLYNRALSAAEVGRLAAGRGCVTDGSDWPTAFEDLQCALDVAAPGDQVWIAGGTYRPGTNRTGSYRLVNGVNLFGGFAGSETSLAQRPPFDPNAPLTVLSGDAAGDDLPGSFANRGENICGVVVAGSNAFPDPVSAAVDGLAIEDGNASCPGLLGVSSGGGLAGLSVVQMSLNNVLFQSNQASNLGGGLFNERGQLSLSGAHFAGNTSAVGGGLAFEGGNVTVTASSFVSNTAGQGGGLDIRPGQGHTTLTVSGSTFTGNQAQDGGAVEDQIGDGLLDLSFDNDTFRNNHSLGGDGGGVDNTGVAPGVVRSLFSQATFESNTSEEDGGAIADFGGELTIADSAFNSNSAPNSNGGALQAASVVTLTHSNFVSNTSRLGGAVAVFGNLTLSDGSFVLNRAQDFGLATNFALAGGGVFVSGTAAITGTHFLSNTAILEGFLGNNLAGGGGLAVNGSLALTSGDFRDNSAELGGGLEVVGDATIQRSLVQHNNAGSGGGVFADGNLVLVTNRLIDNTALETSNSLASKGGGLFLENGGFGGQVSNNLFLGNRALGSNIASLAPAGAALSLDGLATLVSNNTIVDRGFNGTSAASLTGTTGLFNNIITSHTVAIQSRGGLTFDDYNLFHGNTITATGVISSVGHSRVADPRFVAAAIDDYRLRLDSPAVDAGDNNRVPLVVTTDLGGGKRFVDVPGVPDTGAGSAPIVDIGAFEVNGELFLPLIRR